jgi:hypothetical protein
MGQTRSFDDAGFMFGVSPKAEISRAIYRTRPLYPLVLKRSHCTYERAVCCSGERIPASSVFRSPYRGRHEGICLFVLSARSALLVQ